MTLLAPWALLGLLAAAIPIVLHLVQRRDPPERAFPAVQYLQDATRDHRRRLRLRHWLLLLCRTVLLIAIVLAAAGPALRRSVPLGRHAPTAMVLVVDNSASSAAIIDGAPLVESLAAEGRAVLARATPGDRLWLLQADGVVRPGTAAELTRRLDGLVALSTRLDLGIAIRQARELIAESGRPGEVVVLTDAQQTAVAPLDSVPPVVVLRPAGAAPANRAVAVLDAGAQPWGPEGGRIDVALQSADTVAVPVTLEIPGGTRRDALVTPGLVQTMRIAAATSGWHTIRAVLPPDELRIDDQRELALRVAPPAAVEWDPSDRFLAAALDVLQAAGRLRRGGAVRIGDLGAGASVVQPPEDPARIGALNRALAARGSSWRFGTIQQGAERSDSNALLPNRIQVHRRVTLEPVSGGGEVLIEVGGSPWLVRSGNLVLVGSRFDPEWTDLPVRASFVPLLDRLATRTVRGEPVVPVVAAGTAMAVPPRATAVMAAGEASVPIEGGAPWQPPAPGVYWLLAGADTIGAVSAALDPRESDLQRASDAQLTAAWPGAVFADLGGGASRTFAIGGRGDLRPLLLLLALACLVAESLLAGARRALN